MEAAQHNPSLMGGSRAKSHKGYLSGAYQKGTLTLRSLLFINIKIMITSQEQGVRLEGVIFTPWLSNRFYTNCSNQARLVLFNLLPWAVRLSSCWTAKWYTGYILHGDTLKCNTQYESNSHFRTYTFMGINGKSWRLIFRLVLTLRIFLMMFTLQTLQYPKHGYINGLTLCDVHTEE